MKAIVTFHSLDWSGSVLSYPPDAFDELLGSLAESGLPVLSLDDLLKDNTTSGVALTFDDGMRSVYTSALPILKDHGVSAHLYLTTGAVGKNNKWPTQPDSAPDFDMLNWNEIEALHKGGVYIDSHTHTHPDMRALTRSEMEDECETADELIEKRLGRRPRYFAYPYGYSNVDVRDFARTRYRATVTTELRSLEKSDDTAMLPRLDSYYLKGRWLRRNLDGILPGMYLTLRGTLRTLRGTQ